MRRFVLLGDPVEHSLSPSIYTAAFAGCELEARYDTRRVSADDLGAAMRSVAGGNVTLPHKLEAAGSLDLASEDVRSTRACNCFWVTPEGRLAGDNTDVGGLAAALEEASMPVAGRRVLLLGAGGGARAAARVLTRGHAGSVEIFNRSPDRARELAADLGGDRLAVLEDEPRGPYDLVLNATRLGLAEADRLPLDLTRVRTDAAFDLVYGAGGTAWTRHARALGIRATDGLGMLVHQAALSLGHWVPDHAPPLGAMRAAAERALADRSIGVVQGPTG